MSNNNTVNDMIQVMQGNEAFVDMIKQMGIEATTSTNDPSFARFMQAMTEVCRMEVKPVIGEIKASTKVSKPKVAKASSNEPVDNTWRDEQKALFSGRGMQWIYVDAALTEPFGAPTRDGKGWVRYAGPRIAGSQQVAAFEVRPEGSKIPSPKDLVFIAHDVIMAGEFERLEDGKTPFALGLDGDDAPSIKVEPEEVEVEEVELEHIPSDIMDMLNEDDDDLEA